MDPFSIVGFVASIAQLIEAAKKVHDILQTFKDGDKELAALRDDIAGFVEALHGFDRILRSRHTIHRVSAPVLEELLRSSAVNIIELKDRLLQLASSKSSVTRKARWVQHKSSLRKSHDKIREKMTMLHTFLSITQAETLLSIASQYPSFMISESARQASAAESEVLTLETDTSHLHVGYAGTHPRKTSASSSRPSLASVASSDRPLSVFSSAASIESATTMSSAGSMLGRGQDTEPEKLSLLTGKTAPKATQLISEDMLILRRSCRYNCHCACHRQSAEEPPRRFGRPRNSKLDCTDPICRGNEAVQDRSQEHSSMFRTALSKATSARVIKVRYDLHSFRMVPNGSNAVRHVNHGNLPRLKDCIESGEATIWDTTLDGWSLLHSAAYHSHAHIVKYLLDLGVATSTGDVGSRTPTDLAVLKSIGKSNSGPEHEVVEIFGEKDDVLADFEFNPIHLSVLDLYEHHDPERPPLQELLELTDDANNAPVGTDWARWKLKYQAKSPLFGAILEYFRASAFEKPKGTKIMHNLLDEKDKKFHWTPLHWAAYSGRVDAMRTLVQYGAGCGILSNLGANIIHAAVESKVDRGLEVALKIKRMYPDELDIDQVNSWGETAVHIASCISASCVKLLLKAGANPNVRDENGQVALHFAASSEMEMERPKIIEALCGAMDVEHINAQDLHGRPPLFAYLNDAECVEVVIRHGARVDVTDSEGKNAFHHACIQGEHGVLEAMIRVAEHPDPLVARDNHGNTPLIDALSNSNVDCAMVLLSQSDVGPLIGHDGWSPLHYAAKIGDPELLRAVCQHRSFKKSATTLDGKRAKVVAMEAGTWNGQVKKLILEHDYLSWDD